MKVKLKTKQEVEILCAGGKILAQILDNIVKIAKPGVGTGYLEKTACDLIAKAGGRPSFKGYSAGRKELPFPTALCTSLNDELVHAPSIPNRILKTGDILGIDIGMEYPFKGGSKSMYTDMAITIAIGPIKKENAHLLQVTQEALYSGVKAAKPGKTLADIGKAIQKHIEKAGFEVVREMVGHGVGYAVHEDPHIPNYFDEYLDTDNFILKPGMVLALEPMASAGGREIYTKKDGWTIAMVDKSLSAQFEHTVVITEEGSKILTI